MKNFVRIIIWTLIALVMQHSIFLYIEYVYLDTDSEITVQKVEEEPLVEEEENPNEIKIPENALNVSTSLDGRYAAYIDRGNLKVYDSEEKKEMIFAPETKGDIECYKWVNDEDLILVIQRIEEDGLLYFEPVSYDIKKDEARELVDFNYNKMRIGINSEEDKIQNIAFSTATHSLYINIRKANNLCDLYYSNVMNQVERVRYNKEISNIVLQSTNTNAIMEMGDIVTILNDPGNINIPNVELPKLLGIDFEDNVYFGKEEDGKITSIYYKLLDEEKDNWSTYSLKEPTERKNITINFNGKIYIQDISKKSVLELTSGRLLSYEGEFVQTFNEGIIIRNGNKLIKKNVNEISIAVN